MSSKRITLVLEGERPVSLNDFYSGMHWSKRQEAVHRAHTLVRKELGELGSDAKMFKRPVHITVTAYFDKRPYDASNVLVKLYEDALKGVLIENDSPRYVRGVTTHSHIDRKRPRVEITIEECNDETDSK